MARILLAAASAFAISAAVGWFLIPVLRALHAGQSIKEIGPNWHKNKEGTPTMGGIMFILAAAVVVLAFGWEDMAEGSWQALFVLGFALVCGAIGFVDDYAKIRKHDNTGLTAGWKFLLQLAAAIAFLTLLNSTHHLTPNLYIPFVNITIPLNWGVYLVFAAFVIVGCVNSVNLTDGLDGLAGSVTLAVSVFFAVLSHWWDKGAVGVFAGALAGGLLGFLVYNFHPAKVFMGDTGSLFLGGAVCGMAFALDAPLVLVPVGVIYIAETMSDIIQVGYFKLTHGKRIFRMAPLHHHLELGGWSEVRIVLTFTGITVAFCLLAFVGVMYRYAI
jgi:phospho-N-acetylmuramoyl-pentapeptide-transferase